MPINLRQPVEAGQRPSSDLAGMGSTRDIGAALRHLQRQVDYLFSTIGTPPVIDFLSIDAAEIGTLYVGNIDGAGQIEIYSGPPSYDLVGWFGTRDSAQSSTITSITGGTVVIAGLHGLAEGNIVLISGTTNAAHNDYWLVQTIVDESTFTIAATGNSTGGEATRQFRGGWVQEFAHGGTGPEDAPVWSDYFGRTYFGGEASITLLGPQGQAIGYFGTDYDNPGVAVFDASNATPIVIETNLPHNMVDGDTVYIFGVGGNDAANGLFIIHNPTSDTFELYDLNNDPVAGTGAHSGGGTAIPYDSGILVQTIAIGNSFDDYKLRAFADGSLRIQNATIELTSALSSILLDPDQGILQVTGVTNQAEIYGGVLTVKKIANPTDVVTLNPDGLLVNDSVEGNVASILGGSSPNIDSKFGYKVAGTTIIEADRDLVNIKDIDADSLFTSGSVTVSGNLGVLTDATIVGDLTVLGSFNAGGATSPVTTMTGLSVTYSPIQYKDWAGVNQSMFVATAVTAAAFTNWDVVDGIVATIT
jgi:hypothetical protein